MNVYIAGVFGLEDLIEFLGGKGVQYQVVLNESFAGREAIRPGKAGVVVATVYGPDVVARLLTLWSDLEGNNFVRVGVTHLLNQRRWWFMAAPQALIGSPSVLALYKRLSGNELSPPDPGSLDWAKEGGLIPAVVQDAGTLEVLMLAYMSRESYEETLRTGRATYWSRSRGKLWRKGEESGNVQIVKEVRLDCDGDALLLFVEQQGGAACHDGYRSCFYRRLGRLETVGERVFDPAVVYGKNNG